MIYWCKIKISKKKIEKLKIKKPSTIKRQKSNESSLKKSESTEANDIEFCSDEKANKMFEWLLNRFYEFKIYKNKSIEKIKNFSYENFGLNHRKFLQNLYFSNLKFERSINLNSLIKTYYETEILFEDNLIEIMKNLISFYEYETK